MRALLLLWCLLLLCGCSAVSQEELGRVKAGRILIWRYQKADGKNWYYADEITRVEGNKIYYHPSSKEANHSQSSAMSSFDADKELCITREQLLTYREEQGEDRKVVIEIR